MGYYIDAWLEDGVPQLSIRDVRTGAVRLRWAPAAGRKPDRQYSAGRDLQCLFRELVLLSCIGRAALPPPSGRLIEAECRGCPGCTDAGSPLPSPDEPSCAENVISLQDRRDKLPQSMSRKP
jgi:hypothetical protein